MWQQPLPDVINKKKGEKNLGLSKEKEREGFVWRVMKNSLSVLKKSWDLLMLVGVIPNFCTPIRDDPHA